ncbi:MAG: NACHT domain-containing protein [Luteolibacter sp.]
MNPGHKTLLELIETETALLFLLGDPGMGKSTELRQVVSQLQQATSEEGSQLILITFRSVRNWNDFLVKTVHSPAWQSWESSNTRLTLVIDGLDEGILRVSSLVSDLLGLLTTQPLERLGLILVSRWFDGVDDAVVGLLSLWPNRPPKEAIPLFELCPLRREDVKAAARCRGHDSDRFFDQVWDRGVVELASRPVTLMFLIDEFSRGGQLPTSRRELFERGTYNLAQEVSKERMTILGEMGHRRNRCSGKERIEAARRLSALFLLGGRSGFWLPTGVAFEEAPENDVLLEQATGNGISIEAAEEVIQSALFTSLGNRRFGFGQQTFAECLTAQILGKLPLLQVRRLLCIRDIRGEHVVPQLSDLAAWTATYHEDFCKHLLKIEPEILLRNHVGELSPLHKEELVGALLEKAHQNEIFDDWGFNRFLGGLSHPGLTEQLKPWIAGEKLHHIARRIALSIAKETGMASLSAEVLSLINDPSG